MSILRGPSSPPAGHTEGWSVPRPAHEFTPFPNSALLHWEGPGILLEVLTALSKTSVVAPAAKPCYFFSSCIVRENIHQIWYISMSIGFNLILSHCPKVQNKMLQELCFFLKCVPASTTNKQALLQCLSKACLFQHFLHIIIKTETHSWYRAADTQHNWGKLCFHLQLQSLWDQEQRRGVIQHDVNKPCTRDATQLEYSHKSFKSHHMLSAKFTSHKQT